MGNQNRNPNSDIHRILSTNLKRLRQARSYTRRRLGELCGLSNSYISRIERGTAQVSLANLEVLATALGCVEEDLLWVGR